jgi:hypothetical protein
MCHSLLFWVLGALIVSRLIFRARMRRLYGGGCGWGFGGGCGRRRFFRGPIDLGAPDPEPPFGRWARRWRQWEARQAAPAAAAKPVVDVAGSLELNQRQREIYDDVVARAKTSLPAPELAEALSILGREPFDRPALEFLIGEGDLADDLEHLHHSLTTEQRARLRDVTAA